MTSKQSALGRCLLSPFSQGQEKEEKLFFRRNTELLCHLFSSGLHKEYRPTSEATDPIRSVSSHDVINTSSARNHYYGLPLKECREEVKRPRTTSPVSSSKPLHRQAKRPLNLSQTIFAPNFGNNVREGNCHRQRRDETVVNHNLGNGRTSSGLIKKKRSTTSTANERFCTHQYSQRPRTGWQEGERDFSRGDGGESPGISSRHEMLLESHRHPPSIHCDTLGPIACKYCTRRISQSDASFILPDTGVFSSTMSTVRIPPSPREKVIMTPSSVPSQMFDPPPTTVAMPEPYTPLSVFLRTRRKKGEEDRNKDGGVVNIKSFPERMETNNDKMKNESDLSDNDDNEGEEEGDDDEDKRDRHGTGFDGLRVRVTFREKLCSD